MNLEENSFTALYFQLLLINNQNAVVITKTCLTISLTIPNKYSIRTRLPVSPFLMGETGNLVATWWLFGGYLILMK
jgi:hypothetical protein